jgi:hypothetical protein
MKEMEYKMDEIKNALLAKLIDPTTTEDTLRAALKVMNGKTEQVNMEALRFISGPDACIYAGGITRTTLWRWRKQGLQSYSVGGRRLYRTTDLDKFIMGEE